MRKMLEKTGLDVPFIMTGRREAESGSDRKEFREIQALMSEKGIRSADELRQRLEKEDALVRMLGHDAYAMIVKAAVMRDKRVNYKSGRKSGRGS